MRGDKLLMKKRCLLLICLVILLSSSVAGAESVSKYEVDYVGDLSEGLAVFGLWRGEWDYGYIDNKANVIIKPQYQDARDFISGVAAVGVKTGNKPIKYGYIKKDGTYLIKPRFDEARDFHTIPGTKTEVAIVGIGEDKNTRKYGFVKKDGSYLVEPQFDYVAEYTNFPETGYTNVYNIVDGKELYGALNSKGRLVIDTKYTYVSPGKYDVALGYIVTNNDYKHGLYDIKRDKILDPVYSSVLVMDDGVRLSIGNDYREKSGYYLHDGTLIEPKYDALLHWDSREVLCKIQLDNKYGLLGKNGTEILEPVYDEVRDLGTWQYAEKDGKTILITKDGKIGYVREDMTYIVEPVWDSAYQHFEIIDGSFVYYDYFDIKKDDKWGVVFMDGSVIKPVSEIGKNYYHLDVTFNDGGSTLEYFLVSDKFLRNHYFKRIWEVSDYPAAPKGYYNDKIQKQIE